MSQYTASVPSGGQVRPEIRTFFEEFYKATDDADAHERYIGMFTNDAKVFMGVNEFHCRDCNMFRLLTGGSKEVF
jgi:hypothetical protein